MSLTREQRQAHNRYENGAPIIREVVVDAAYKAARKVIEATGMNVANDDRAEALIAAIEIYIEDSADCQ